MVQACSQDFLGGGAILRQETDQTMPEAQASGLGGMQVA